MASTALLTSTAAGQLAIGIDMGGTSVKLGVCRDAKLLFQAHPISTRNFRGAKDLLEAMRQAILALRQETPGIAAVGVGVFVPLKKKLNAQLHKTFRHRVRIVRARFGNEAGIIGSAAVALERLSANGTLVISDYSQFRSCDYRATTIRHSIATNPLS